jgi:hypothetical protein
VKQPKRKSPVRRAVILKPGKGRAYPMGRIGAVFKADGAESKAKGERRKSEG